MVTVRSHDPLDGERGAGMAVSGIKPVLAFHSGLGRPWCIESERGSGGAASASPAQRLAMARAESPSAANGSAVKPMSPLRRCDWRPVGERAGALRLSHLSHLCLSPGVSPQCRAVIALVPLVSACPYKAPSPHPTSS